MTYDTDALTRDFGAIMKSVAKCRIDPDTVFAGLPRTFVEPGKKERWIFDTSVAVRIASLLAAIGEIQSEALRRLFRILLASILIDVSNVVISGKGQRYRRGWQRLKREPLYVDMAFCDVVQNAISDIHRYVQCEDSRYEIWRGDSRTCLWETAHCELAVFSPPYPNSFDYTDVYNIELWTLGYLTDNESNRTLRISTFCSHVQIGRIFPPPPSSSGALRMVRSLQRGRTAGCFPPPGVGSDTWRTLPGSTTKSPIKAVPGSGSTDCATPSSRWRNANSCCGVHS